MKKVIYNAFYFENKNVKAPNLLIRGGVNIYWKNSYVSLKSAKLSNPDCDVAIVTNNIPPQRYVNLFDKDGIKIFVVPFDDYCMPKNFKWEYAFYKLKALEYMSSCKEYDFILGVDLDTYFTGCLCDLWEECNFDCPVLYPLAFPINEHGRIEIINDFEIISGKKIPVIQYGGEFIAGSRKALKKLSDEIKTVYLKIKKMGFPICEDSGDEAILSMAASNIKIINATPYVRRYWARRADYIVDSDWKVVPVWHVPAEKNYGLLKMFDKLLTIDSLMDRRKAAKQFNLPFQNKYSIQMIKYYIYSLLNR